MSSKLCLSSNSEFNMFEKNFELTFMFLDESIQTIFLFEFNEKHFIARKRVTNEKILFIIRYFKSFTFIQYVTRNSNIES